MKKQSAQLNPENTIKEFKEFFDSSFKTIYCDQPKHKYTLTNLEIAPDASLPSQ